MSPFHLTISPDVRELRIGERTWLLATWENMGWWRLARTTTGLQVTMWAAGGKGCVSVGSESWLLSGVSHDGTVMTASAEAVDFTKVAEEVLKA